MAWSLQIRRLNSISYIMDIKPNFSDQFKKIVKRYIKPHSHCAGVATVHPDAGQPVYRDAPGHIS